MSHKLTQYKHFVKILVEGRASKTLSPAYEGTLMSKLDDLWVKLSPIEEKLAAEFAKTLRDSEVKR